MLYFHQCTLGNVNTPASPVEHAFCSTIYVGQGPTYVVWLGIPSWVIIDLNRRCSSVMETQLTIHHRS